MKKILLASFILTLSMSVTNLFAQACTPDPQYENEEAGVYPLPDTVGSVTSVLPTACVGLAYEALWTAVVPDSLTVELVPGSPTTLDLVSVTVTDITGLPPGADTWVCEPSADCVFPDQAVGCLAVVGTPTTAGDYFPIVVTDVNVGATLEVTFPGSIFPGQYKIIVQDAANCTIGVNDAFASKLELGQNIPNPFSNTTQISIDSKESGEFDFKVYSLIGEMVHAERVNLMTGENTVEFDASKLNSGVYFYAIGQGNSVITKRMVVSK